MPNFRVTFSKDDVLVFISHLDLNHAFIRALNRAQVPLRYSEGFNPHPKLVFALPLSVGMAGENELLDIGIADESMTAERLLLLLREQMPPHVTVKDVCEPEKKFKDICAARYRVVFFRTGFAERLKDLLGGEIKVVKKTKSGEKETDIAPQVQAYRIEESDGQTAVDLKLDAGPDGYLNPELLVKAMRERGVIGENEPYAVSRTAILFA